MGIPVQYTLWEQILEYVATPYLSWAISYLSQIEPRLSQLGKR